MNDSALIHDLLTGARTIAVVGYSTDPTRPSNSVSRYLRGQGFRIVPVNPKLRGAVIDGEQSYDHLVDIPAETRIDVADIFRRGDFLDDVVDDAIAAKIPAIWFQLDLGNIAAAERAEAAGLGVVWDRCTAIEHRRLRAP
ncbi:MAG TPA: CoA-binding protein [Candidatus Limnocylindria bacterium]|nr:CoA-binding protein [Candidatus Limnocylindria bacterium]